MATEDDNRAFSTKEMLARLDSKLDTVIAQQADARVQVALHEQRITALEASDSHADGVHNELRDQVERITRKVAYAAGGVSAIVTAAGLAVGFLH